MTTPPASPPPTTCAYCAEPADYVPDPRSGRVATCPECRAECTALLAARIRTLHAMAAAAAKDAA